MDNVQWDLLKLTLFWVIGGGGAGAGAFFIVAKVRPLARLSDEPKRWAGLGIAAGLAMLAYGGAVGLGYLVAPVGWQGWLESLFAVGGLAAGVGQLIHGRVKAAAVARAARGS